MSKSDSRGTVIDIINDVRRRLGYKAVQRLDSDRYSEMLLRLLNKVITHLSDKGDWQEQQRTVAVTAFTSTVSYELGINEPVKRIYEISFDDDPRSLDYISIERMNQYLRRGSGVGRPRFFTIQGVDNQGNPKFKVSRQPGTAENGLTFSVEYYVAPRLFDLNSIEDEVTFPKNVVVEGLYAEGLLEQNGGQESREYVIANAMFEDMRREAMGRFTFDTGTDIYLMPGWNR